MDEAYAGMVAGVVIAVLIFTAFLMFISCKCYLQKRKRSTAQDQKDAEKGESLSQQIPDFLVRFSYETLMTATHNFDLQKKLGAGGFGSVFEGTLTDGTKIAVKRLDRLGQGRMEFLAEVQTIGCVHHVNLVKLIGFCAQNEHKLLVYEYLRNGSLDKWIFSTNPTRSLDWDTKRKIILQIAKGLAYLHEGSDHPTIAHLDIKPQNVLLDHEFNVKLSDFGLAKVCDKNESYVMIQVRGTRGYLAPEWLGTKITETADVYSYGVVVLEIIFGRKNLDYSQPENKELLIHMVKEQVEEEKLFDLLGQCSDDMERNFEDIENIVNIALWCLHTEPEQRPSMSMVVKVLEGEMIMQGISDYALKFVAVDGKLSASETMTQLSASVLSGPR